MNIGSLIQAQLQLAQFGQLNPIYGTGDVSQALAPVNQRLSTQLESANVRLSAFGQVRSAFDSAQTSAIALTEQAASKTATDADVVKAAQAFVAAYNQAIDTVGAAVSRGTGKTGALAADIRATLAGNGLARTFVSGTAPADLKQAGITLGKGGKLTLDTKTLQQALQANGGETKAALGRLGQQLDTRIGNELAATGNVGRSIDTLTYQSKLLGAQQTVLGLQASMLQQTLDQQSAVFNYAALSGLSQYQNMLLRST